MKKNIWRGGSHRPYLFDVFPLNHEFPKGALGNYIFASETIAGWVAIYIGEGEIKERTNDVEHRSCAIRRGATHIHARLDSNEKSRKEIETDLLDGNKEAYFPIGCNRKTGG